MFKKMQIFKPLVYLVIIVFFVQCNDPGSKEIVKPTIFALKDTSQSENMLSDSAKVVISSEITCPKCGFKKTEIIPTDVCQIKYTCEKCKTILFPKKGDCCVFCTYGDKKCPSMQD